MPSPRPILILTFALTFLLAAACADSPDARPPGSDLVLSSIERLPGERIFLLDNTGFHELLDDERTLLVPRPEDSFIHDAAISPDGERIALAIQAPPRQTPTGYDFGVDLFVAVPGGEPLPIALHQRLGETMSRPVWLPGTDTILFAVLGRDETGAADLRIELVDTAVGERERFLDNALEPALSPTGDTLAYLSYDETTGEEVIMLHDLATGESWPLLPPHQIMFNVANFAWSPDGDTIAFAAADPVSMRGPAGGGPLPATVHPTLRDVWLVRSDGTGLRRLTELADSTLSLAWSASGEFIYAIGDTGFWLIHPADGTLQRLGAPTLAGRVQTIRS